MTPPLVSTFRRAVRAFTLIELMIVVALISILAMLAVPSMIRARNERHAIAAAGNFSLTFREARARAAGRGAAQLVTVQVGPGTGQRGVVRTREALDAVGNPFPNCRTASWNQANVLATDVAALDLNGGLSDQIGIQTSVTRNNNAFVLCFAPNGRVYKADTVALLSVAPELRDAVEIRVFQAENGHIMGRQRSVLLTPNGQTRVQTSQGN